MRVTITFHIASVFCNIYTEMPAQVPSRQALRYLSSLCHNTESSARSVCMTMLQPVRSRSSISRNPQAQCSHSSPLYSRRSFTSTSTHRVQASTAEPDSDPQNTASPSLPDITNYYTLFQNTLPDGPPGANPLVQTETSSTSSAEPTPAQFTIHVPTLRKEFLRLQSLHHPDKYATGSSAHSKALALSAYINAAYKTLSDPLSRAQYLLQLQHDIDVTNEDNAAHPTDQETLMEVMEAQERIEEAADQSEVDALKEENLRRIVETEKSMGAAFESGDVGLAKDECIRLKYWKSLQGALEDWEPGKEVKLIH